VREAVEKDRRTADAKAGRLADSRRRLDARARAPREGAPRVDAVYRLAAAGDALPAELRLPPGKATTLRGELGRALAHFNKASGGAVLVAAADLLGSTSVSTVAAGFGDGYWNAAKNPAARTLATGGICEDAMAGILSGLSTFGHHVGVGSSYGAFLAPLGHIAARLHAIGSQAALPHGPWNPMVLVCAHAGLKTGEDGPTHADPQPLQLLQENFPDGTAITLTPWDPQESWPLLAAAFRRRPALVAPFVTRPTETVLDRAALGLAPVEAAAQGVYLLRAPRKGDGDVTIVLQESAVTYAFVQGALPRLEKAGIDPRVYYVSSAELFALLPPEEQARIFPEARGQEAMGITGFTLATLYRWVRSERGRAHSLHPFRGGRFLGSGQGAVVLAEAGLDGASQAKAVEAYVRARAETRG
jgi:transketolase